MTAIFFDLETTDLAPVGQIINFCFIAVDDDFSIIGECSDLVRLSRLQLPRAGAIAANRTDVLNHQKEALLNEPQAMEKISSFINGIIQEAGDYKAQLIGFNSANFDLNYLRTSMIRNGVYPYLKISNKDLLLTAQKLFVSNETFKEKLLTYCQKQDIKPNLKLETLCKCHGLLDGAQTHESRDDVIITIKLAQCFLEQYGLDVRTAVPYEPIRSHNKGAGTVVCRNVLQRRSFETFPMYYALLVADHRQALWVDLEKFKQEKEKGKTSKSISWFNFERHPFFVHQDQNIPLEVEDLAQEAIGQLKGVTLRNYFGETSCDIEQFIYRVHPGRIAELKRIFNKAAPAKNLSSDEKELFRRYRIANHEKGAAHNDAMLAALGEYAVYRYGGKMQLSRSDDSYMHPTLEDLKAEIETVEKEVDAETQELMCSLREFYEQSEVMREYGQMMEKR